MCYKAYLYRKDKMRDVIDSQLHLLSKIGTNSINLTNSRSIMEVYKCMI